jgi:hypothetical protein
MSVVEADQQARQLLERMRRTAMRRGAISRPLVRLRKNVAAAINAEGIAAALSNRVALQLVYKFDASELGDRAVWAAIGRTLLDEVEILRRHVGLVDRQLTEALPKLSARDLEAFLEELRATDRRIARTILNAALQASDPLAAGRRYLSEYLGVARHVQAIDPSMARTLANASFTASTPRRKAMEHLEHIAALGSAFARLATLGLESGVAETLAGSSRFRGYLRHADRSRPSTMHRD